MADLMTYTFATAHPRGAAVGLLVPGHGRLRLGETTRPIVPLPDGHRFIRLGLLVSSVGAVPHESASPEPVPVDAGETNRGTLSAAVAELCDAHTRSELVKMAHTLTGIRPSGNKQSIATFIAEAL